jgi:hypothetical protein
MRSALPVRSRAMPEDLLEAPDEAAARRIMDEDPAISSGIARGELRPFRTALLRGA